MGSCEVKKEEVVKVSKKEEPVIQVVPSQVQEPPTTELSSDEEFISAILWAIALVLGTGIVIFLIGAAIIKGSR